jgi:ApbE superfamily uncharacterized protein (UPF0280 family)
VARGKKADNFEMQISGTTLRLTASEDLYEESRASAMQFWDRLSSYSARNHEFRASKRPIELPEDAPEGMRSIAVQAAAAGVGPMFAFKGALTDHVGAFLARRQSDVVVATGGGYYASTKQRTKLTVFRGEERGEGFAIVVDPRHGPLGVYTTMGRSDLTTHNVDALVVLATSCTLADAAATYALGLLDKPDEQLTRTLAYLQDVPGIVGAIVLQDGRIGLGGAVEIAA